MADELIALFGKITTDDHDQLVEQFSRILQVQAHVATFFLEASNWNVELAVHNYLASHQRDGGNEVMPLSSPPMANFVGDLSKWQSVQFQPGVKLPVRLHIQNSGTAPWPSDTHLTFVDGDHLNGKQSIRVHANPGDVIEILLILTSPVSEGTAMGNWRLACSQGYFGDPIFLIITSSMSAAPVEFPEFRNSVDDLNVSSLNLLNSHGPRPNEFAPPQNPSQYDADDVSMDDL